MMRIKGLFICYTFVTAYITQHTLKIPLKFYFCLDHPAGDVKIEVACGETVICKPVIFKYKPNLANPGSRLQPFKEFDTMDSSRGRSELDLKRCLLSKLEKLEICSLEQVQQIYEVIPSIRPGFDN